MHCHLRRDAIGKLKSSSGFKSELQTNSMPFHLDSLWGATLMPLRASAMDWRRWVKLWSLDIINHNI